jgi:hypothetical protein
MGNNKKDWESDFNDFVNSESANVPTALTESVLAVVEAQLLPSAWAVFAKLALIQVVAGSVSLIFCPQFGVSFTSTHGLMQYLMPLGKGVCMLGCGAIFSSTSFLIAALALRTEEVRAIRGNRILQISALTALSLGAFVCSGADVVLSLSLLWAVGGALGGLATLELGWSVRRWTYQRSSL